MLQIFTGWAQSRTWWLFLIILCFMLEAIALFYQYQLGYLPCVLCIHVRMLLALAIIVAIFALSIRKNSRLIIVSSLATVGIWTWMTERSYQLLATERGWNMGECSMESGLPAWLALEKWFPWLFHIHEPCGYTPYIVAQISMAEVLIVLSVLLALVSLVVVAVAIAKRPL